jgi:hypothetical protein
MGKQIYDYAVIDKQITQMIADGCSMAHTARLIGCSSFTVRNRVLALGIQVQENRGKVKRREHSYQPPRESCLRFHSLLTTLIDARSKTTISTKRLVGKVFKSANEGKLKLKKVALV